MIKYRSLTDDERYSLEKNGCKASDWSAVQVGDGFDTAFLSDVEFSGSVRIGAVGKMIDLPGRITVRCGIYNSRVINCVIGNDVYIRNAATLANYEIGDGVYIDNVITLSVTCRNSFGNGTKAAVINEAGGRDIPIYEGMSAQSAAIMALLRNRTELISAMEGMAGEFANGTASETGTIGAGARIVNSRIIENIRIGEVATIEGAEYLKNGTILSSSDQRTYIGPGVYAKNFIVCAGGAVSEGASIHNCFVGECTEISRGFSAENCVFSANCVMHNGEAGSVFAGPFTTSHHKSSLLLAGMFSFFNAGSGTNQSNHMYKLGPVHQGIVERGCKTGSDSYMLWPARIGAFTTVVGRVSANVDTGGMPFSFLISEGQKTYLVPGTAVKSVGTLRDIHKWPKRDRREVMRRDRICFEGMSPYTVQNMIIGTNQLESVRTAAGVDAKEVSLGGVYIRSAALEKGLEYYDLGITKYLGQELVTRLKEQDMPDISALREILSSKTLVGQGRWADLAGMLLPEEALIRVCEEIEQGEIKTLAKVEAELDKVFASYEFYKWSWSSSRIENRLSTSMAKVMPEDLISLLNEYKYAVEQIGRMIIEDAQKEFEAAAKTGYGFDGETAARDADFEAVRGAFENNEFVKLVKDQNASQVRAADEVIRELRKLCRD